MNDEEKANSRDWALAQEKNMLEAGLESGEARQKLEAPRAVDPGQVRDGGPAFPQLKKIDQIAIDQGLQTVVWQSGMSTRTWLTGECMSGTLVKLRSDMTEEEFDMVAKLVAHFAVRVADAAIERLGL